MTVEIDSIRAVDRLHNLATLARPRAAHRGIAEVIHRIDTVTTAPDSLSRWRPV
ncbi:hypothetical protein ACFQX7_27875 [Luedemannella flava]